MLSKGVLGSIAEKGRSRICVAVVHGEDGGIRSDFGFFVILGPRAVPVN